ncbi:MAG: TolC family protein [Bacteroidetes bacterium]|nr:MAG: TolC family protein [Bacteroidota bacterium]
MKQSLAFLLTLLLFGQLSHTAHAQIPVQYHLTLEEVILVAREQSPDALAARHRYRGSYWQHRSFQAGYLPGLRLDATLPNLFRNIQPVTLPDGTDVYVRRSQASSSADLSLNQRIGLTGGQVFLSTGLERIDIFSDTGDRTAYLSTPINIGFTQPIFSYNPYKWERQIEPLRFEEARKRYIEDLETISLRANNFFFDLLLAQINIEINTLNLNNNDTLYQISKGRYSLGRIAENELLQMELNVLNSEAQLEQSRIDYEAALFRFRSYLGLENVDNVQLVIPEERHQMFIEVEAALNQARQNRSDILAFERQEIEAQSEVSRARSESRFNANLFAVYGLTQTADRFSDVYVDPLDQQQLRVGVQIPIVDWGVGKGKVRMAESNRELVNTNVQQALIDFEQEIFLRVMEFNMLERQLLIAGKADTIAEKRYEVSRQRYLIGRIDILELNIALEEKDRSKQRYLAALRNYWRGYYEMRRLTLYDFREDGPITLNFNEI